MPSPFPGMDPYIESWIWEDFHARLIPAIYDKLNPALPKRYIASTELYITQVDPSNDDEQFPLTGPDLHIAERETAFSGAAVATAEAPINTTIALISRKRRYIKIVDQEERRVVTVIEVLSPSNKTGGDNGEAYRLKRQEFLGGEVSLVEIDLLRSGQRPPLGEPVPAITDYYILVHRSWRRTRLAIWPFSVREAIPPVHVPLDPDVQDVVLDLRSCIDHVYDFGRYGEQFDYSRPPRPPLREPDATWARDLLASRISPT